MFMKYSRNLTLTMLRAPDKAWGVCYDRNNCTGMIGMVNKGEADLGIGETAKLNFNLFLSLSHKMALRLAFI